MTESLFPGLDTPNYASACFPPARAFQESAHGALREGVRQGHRCQLLMSPTGSGKTYLGLRIGHEALLRGKRAVFVCDRTTLIDQTSKTADRYGLSAHGIMQADHWKTKASMPFQIASAQTIARRDWPDADVIIIDEAHTQMRAWTEHIQTCRAMVIGLSATPFSPGLGRLFTRLVNATTMHELTESGVLVPMRVLSCTRPDMTGAETSGGEWTDRAAAERGMGIVGDVVSQWEQHGEGRKTIVFGATVAHCEELCRQFNQAGFMAALFTSHTTQTERTSLLTEYRKPDSKLRLLISVEALAKGFDVPDVGCVCDARPLRKSLSTAIQMWGRGLRSDPDTGKRDCILLDFSGNILRFKADFENIYFHGLATLDSGEKLDKAIRREDDEVDEKACPECDYRPFVQRCMGCGHEVQRPALVAAPGGQMREIVMMNGKRMGDDVAHVWAQVATYARGHSVPDMQQARAEHLFRDITGKSAPRDWRVATTPGVEITRNVMNKIKAGVIAFIHAKKKAASAV